MPQGKRMSFCPPFSPLLGSSPTFATQQDQPAAHLRTAAVVLFQASVQQAGTMKVDTTHTHSTEQAAQGINTSVLKCNSKVTNFFCFLLNTESLEHL